jgi:hypothetical protein
MLTKLPMEIPLENINELKPYNSLFPYFFFNLASKNNPSLYIF